MLCTVGKLRAALGQWGMLKVARKVESGQNTGALGAKESGHEEQQKGLKYGEINRKLLQ